MKELPARFPGFPPECVSVGQRVEYVSKVLLPARRFEEYVALMGQVLAPDIHYIDPVHELHGSDAVLAMLERYAPRAANDKFVFELLVDAPDQAVWRWTMAVHIKFGNYEFIIHGLVHAEIRDGFIVHQREYFDPMESIGVIPFVGRLYKRLLMTA